METAIVSLMCIVLIVFGGMTMSQGFLTSSDTTALSMEEISVRDGEIMRTELSTVNATLHSSSMLEVRLQNNGQTKLASFSKWDVIVQYYRASGKYYVEWLPYTEGILGNNEWQKAGIYLNGEPEAFEPDILNPGEEIRIMAKLSPPVGPDTTNSVVVSTPNGISASASFVRE